MSRELMQAIEASFHDLDRWEKTYSNNGFGSFETYKDKITGTVAVWNGRKDCLYFDGLSVSVFTRNLFKDMEIKQATIIQQKQMEEKELRDKAIHKSLEAKFLHKGETNGI